MKRLIAFPLLAMLLVCANLGCAGKELSVALRTYTVTMERLVEARDAGQISDKTQAEIIAPARDGTKAILDEAVDAYIAGTPFDWRIALQRAYRAMAPLLRQRTILEGK